MKNKIRLSLALALVAGVISAPAQTNLTQVPNLITNPPPGISSFAALADLGVSGALGNLWTAIDSSAILQATNWAVAPYATYAPSAVDKIGGGVLAIYNVPQLSGNLGSVGAALGADWLGSWSLVSGNITIQTDTRPLAHITWLSGAPAWVTNIVVTPFALVGVGTPMSGGTQGAATIWDTGAQIKFGHWLGGNFGTGITWGEWMNAGKESGHRYHFFLSYQKGF
jgi:hypothetical protein